MKDLLLGLSGYCHSKKRQILRRYGVKVDRGSNASKKDTHDQSSHYYFWTTTDFSDDVRDSYHTRETCITLKTRITLSMNNQSNQGGNRGRAAVRDPP